MQTRTGDARVCRKDHKAGLVSSSDALPQPQMPKEELKWRAGSLAPFWDGLWG